MYFRCSPHLNIIFESPKDYKRLVIRISKQMIELKKKKPFCGIVFRGHSGAALAYPLSARLKVPLICVRKLGEISHGRKIEGSSVPIRRYIIIDDFIDTGKTINQLIEAIDRENRCNDASKYNEARCVGIVLYDSKYRKQDTKKFFMYNKRKIPVHHWG